MIEDYRFGTIQVNGKRYDGDIKIVSGEVVSDWWRKEGHAVDFSDIEDILAARPETLVVGMGEPGNMRVREALRKHIAEVGITLIEEPTARAVETFNELSGPGRRVAGAFHLTC